MKKQFVIHLGEVTTFLSLCLIHLNFGLKMVYWFRTVSLIIVNKYFICGREFNFTMQQLPCSWKHVTFVLECNIFFQSYTCKYNFDVSPNKMFLINLWYCLIYFVWVNVYFIISDRWKLLFLFCFVFFYLRDK